MGETVENMLRQTLSPMEVIVVDDGSTDNSAEVIRSFRGKVRLVQQENSGPGAARNAGLKVAMGDFIQFMDSDDLASLNKFEVQHTYLTNSGADFAYGPWIRSRISEKQIKFHGRILQAGPVPESKPMLEWFISGWSLVFQNCLFRRSVLEQAGWYRTDLMPSEDSEYFVRILLTGAKPVHTPGCLVFYREQNPDKITAGGTSSLHRINDWTNFLNISGNQLKDRLPQMKPSTRIALAASVQSHLENCMKNNVPGLPSDHPYQYSQLPLTKALSKVYKYYNRFRRRLRRTPDFHNAFSSIEPSAAYKDLVSGAGYKLVE